MERLLDELIRHVRAIEITGVDVIHARGECGSEHGERGFDVARGPINPRPRELHRAVPNAIDRECRARVSTSGGSPVRLRLQDLTSHFDTGREPRALAGAGYETSLRESGASCIGTHIWEPTQCESQPAKAAPTKVAENPRQKCVRC